MNDPHVIEITAQAGSQPARLSYPQLFTPKKFDANDPNSKPKYSAVLLLDKKVHAVQIKKIQAVIAELVKKEFKGATLPADRICLRDGALKTSTETESGFVDGYGPDVMFVSTSTDKRPGVVDRQLAPLTEQDGKPYAGCYVYARFRLWAQGGVSNPSKFGKRINAGLVNVQFVKDGPAFGAGSEPAESGFAAIPDAEDAVG